MNRRRETAFQPVICLATLAVIMVLLNAGMVLGARLHDVPIVVEQPDGEVLHLFASGDEFYNWVHDADDFTIVRDPKTGYAEYAMLQAGDLVSSGYRVGSVDPAVIGLKPGLNLSPERMQELRQPLPVPDGLQVLSGEIALAPKTGTLNNLAVFIRFSDELEFTDAISTYDGQFNTAGTSMYSYFQEASYGALSTSTTFYPTPPGTTVVSYQDVNSRGYYEPYAAVTNPDGYPTSAERTIREHTLLANAVNAISYQVPPGLDIDGDGDGYVDNVCFVVYGGPTGWGTLLWPHKWDLYSQTVYINSKRVYTYNFQLQSMLNVSVLCHEMFHSLGAPDLYRYYDTTIEPVGPWDLMAWDNAQHMSAYMKYEYGGWIASIPEITPDGSLYTLNPLTSATGQCYKIASSNSLTEYFVVEYRQDTGNFESGIPASGLIVYRIDPAALEGNRYGPPDEVYVYRLGGTTPTTNGNIYSANYSSDVGRTAISDATNPSSFLSDGSPGGLSIYDVGSAGSTISFRLGSPTAAVFRVDSTGNVLADQAFYGDSFQTGAADVAEWVLVSEAVEAGDVLELDPENPQHYRKTTGSCSSLVAGVVSTQPGVLLGSPPSPDQLPPTADYALLALIGIVPVKACDEGGPIEPGNLLVPASIPGYVRRWDPERDVDCPFVGKALEPLEAGTGSIDMLLMR